VGPGVGYQFVGLGGKTGAGGAYALSDGELAGAPS
jgi:hypothetical protein